MAKLALTGQMTRMSDLARRHAMLQAKDSPASRWAVNVGLLVLFIIVFFMGLGVGRWWGSTMTVVGPPHAFATVPDRSLTDLLGEIARGGDGSPVDAVTYTAYEGGHSIPSPRPKPPEPEASAESRIVRATTSPPTMQAPPPGSWTVVLGWWTSEQEVASVEAQLRGVGIGAWRALEASAEGRRWRLSVGGYESQDGATRALASVTALLGARASLASLTPEVAASSLVKAAPVAPPVK